MAALSRLDRYRDGIPVYRYVMEPETPPVHVLRHPHTALEPDQARPHIHDFPALLYVERDVDAPLAGIQAGDLYLAAPGDVVRPPPWAFRHAGAAVVFFAPEALGGDQPAAPATWWSHPLLFPFVHGRPTGLLRLRVPSAERPEWTRLLAALETELTERRGGYQQAARAHLTLLLVSVARLATDLVEDLRRSDEPLLAEVFAVIERGYPDRLSLRDVARAVNLTPGHLTTAVRRRTGRTVQDWILQRRMTQARRLLAENELSVGEVGRRVGLPDPGYFARTFRREHGMSPRDWRGACRRLAPEGRPGEPSTG